MPRSIQLLVFFSALLVPVPPAAAQTPVGVAAVDITPDYPIRLNGFGFRREESEGVRQPIWAKALAIGADEEGPVLLIACDTLGIPDQFVEQLAARLKADAGIERSRLAVTATHTHTGPMVNNVSPTIFSMPIPAEHQAHIDRYTAQLKEHLYQVAMAALKDRRPATLAWGLGSVRFAANRRAAGGPVDHDLPLLAVKSPDGQLRAVYVNYACHCVSLSDNKISGDWAGYAQELIQRAHPGAAALVSIGCGADANPSTGVTGDKAEVAEKHGLEIAEEVNRLLETELVPLAGPITARLERIVLPLAPLPSRDEWEARAREQSAVGHHARTQLARLDAGQELLSEISYPIQTWSFGDALAMVFLPGEVVVDYSLRLKRDLDGRRLWVNGYANGCPGYIPSERILREGGYEGGGAMIYYDIPGPYAPGLEDNIVAVVRDQLGEGFKPPVDPNKTQGVLPRSPRQSLASLRTRPDLAVELVASEPLVASPVAIDFGPDGRVWVAEMYDYPSGTDNNFTPGGRVKFLEDTDGDGRLDRATTFLEDIPFPTGVTVWRGGLLVCAAPDILYAEDTDGDGRADRVQKLYSGFATHNYQGRVNSLEYGLDGWVHGSAGLFGGEIASFRGGDPLLLSQRDFRIRPDAGQIEPAAGAAQQGRVRDDWGNWFGCNSGMLVEHYPLPDHYLRRNPNSVPPAPAVPILRGPVVSGPDPGRLFPIADTVLFKLSGPPGGVTAACGLGIYRDDLLGSQYTGNAFTCEPVNNLVHRRLLVPDGITFKAVRAGDEAASEFLASTDPWFRPVQVRTAPDGALWVVDMYRYVIEHPIWIPPETLRELDVRAGADMGRIYRVVPREGQPRKPLRLDRLDAAQLVAALDSPNAPQRDQAMQQLLWRGDDPAVAGQAAAPLEQLARQSSRPETRLQALCTLDGLGALEPRTIVAALSDDSPGVRRHAVRLAEKHLADPAKIPGELATALLDRLDDADLQVQLQLVFTLGQWNDPRAAGALAALAIKHQPNRHLTAAALSSLNRENVEGVVMAALASGDGSKVSNQLVENLFVQAAALADDALVRQLLRALIDPRASGFRDPHAQFSTATSTLAALVRHKRPLDQLIDDRLRRELAVLLDHARTVAADADLPDEARIVALRFIGQASPAAAGAQRDADLAAGLLGPRSSPAVQSAAVAMLAQLADPDLPGRLLSGWQSHGPQLRGQIIDLLLSRADWTTALLDALEQKPSKPVDPADSSSPPRPSLPPPSSLALDLVQQQRLTQHPDQAIRERALALFTKPGDSDRQRIVDEYAAALDLPGDVVRGKAVFEKRCAACHRLDGVGNEVGADLSPYAAKPPQALLIALFDPNQAVDPRYHSYVAALTDGRVLTGTIIDETGTSLTLVSPEGKKQPVLRADIDELANTGKSLMPEGFERELSLQDTADLVVWFSRLRSPPKALAGNQPSLAGPAADGSLALTAAKAEIRGQDITFEEHFGNVGYWHGPDDHVRWQVELPAAARLDVWLDWSCAADSAGNAFLIRAGAEELQGTVESTGGWNTYRQARVGSIDLPAGQAEITVRPAGPLNRALFDLRAVYLMPPGQAPQLVQAGAREPKDPASLARYLLNDSHPAGQRAERIDATAGVAAEVLAVMVADLTPGANQRSRKEEYRRIPWIWRVSIAAGRRNDPRELRALLNVALPKPGEPMHDWQAVALGGGLINGISLSGHWPRAQLEKLLNQKREPASKSASESGAKSSSVDPLLSRWRRSIELAVAMADNEPTPAGTRYDALRMVAMQDWSDCHEQLTRYLAKGIHDELQMGAISGLSDIPSPEVAAALLSGIAHYSDSNRNLVFDALLRTSDRARALLAALSSGVVTAEQLGPDRLQAFRAKAEE